ncbi:MAG: HAD family hydrolase, partial [Oscillospiraceae bacterium]|nr:HAD family hydrolase [Oscillospiraceae bacterium]
SRALTLGGYAPHSMDDTRRFVGSGSRALVRRSLPPDTPEEEVDRVLAIYREEYRAALVVDTVPYEGMAEMLGALRRRGLALGVVTNKPHENAVYIIDRCFPGVFGVTEGSREGRPFKPSPEAVEAALAVLGVRAERTLYVGDSEVDFRTAANAGMDCVLCSWGYRPRQELEKYAPAGIIDAPGELLSYLD